MIHLPTIVLTPRRLAITLGALALAAAALVLSGCGLGKISEPYNDSPVGQHLNGPADVANMPDGFSNWADKCDGKGHRVYVAFHGDGSYAGITVIADPTCKTASSGSF